MTVPETVPLQRRTPTILEAAQIMSIPMDGKISGHHPHQGLQRQYGMQKVRRELPGILLTQQPEEPQ